MPRKSFTFEGKRYFVRGKTEEEAIAKKALLKRDLQEGKVIISSNMTTSQWFDEFMKSYKKRSISDETYDDYISRWNSKIKPSIGSMKLGDVRQIHCQNVISQMEGCSKTYIGKVANTMYQMFARAKINKLIADNPATDLEYPEAEDGTHRAITAYERKITLQVSEYHRGGLWVLIMLYCGLRPSEAAALQWRHVNLKKKSVLVEGATKKKSNRVGKTKTPSGNRVVPIPDVLLKKLKAGDPFDYVLTNMDGKRLSKTNMRVMWNNFKREMNIAAGCKVYRNEVLPPFRIADDLVPYCYRHTFCTDLEAAGVSINEAARLMGHKNIAVTSKIYTHASPESFARVSELINAHHDKKAKKSRPKLTSIKLKRANDRAKIG